MYFIGRYVAYKGNMQFMRIVALSEDGEKIMCSYKHDDQPVEEEYSPLDLIALTDEEQKRYGLL